MVDDPTSEWDVVTHFACRNILRTTLPGLINTKGRFSPERGDDVKV
jgi:hypothetical protein